MKCYKDTNNYKYKNTNYTPLVITGLRVFHFSWSEHVLSRIWPVMHNKHNSCKNHGWIFQSIV